MDKSEARSGQPVLAACVGGLAHRGCRSSDVHGGFGL